MAKKENVIPVYYDVYEQWEHLPVERLFLGQISPDTATRLIRMFREMSGTVKNSCLNQICLDYRTPKTVRFNATYSYNSVNQEELSLDGIQLNCKSMCTGREWRDDKQARNCIRQMRRGKCICPAGRVIASAIWSEIYAKNKENSK